VDLAVVAEAGHVDRVAVILADDRRGLALAGGGAQGIPAKRRRRHVLGAAVASVSRLTKSVLRPGARSAAAA
jgi:hypothetical protein